jgi:hypothetical protein
LPDPFLVASVQGKARQEKQGGFVVHPMAVTPDQDTPLANIRKAGWFVVGLGAAFLILGIAVPVAHQLVLATKTGRATGTVVDHTLFPGSGKMDHILYATGASNTLRPVIEFRTASGALQRFQNPKTWPGVADQMGQEVPVAYDPADPSQATVDDIRDILYPLFICFTVGLSCLLGGTWVLTRFTSSDQSSDGVAA